VWLKYDPEPKLPNSNDASQSVLHSHSPLYAVCWLQEIATLPPAPVSARAADSWKLGGAKPGTSSLLPFGAASGSQSCRPAARGNTFFATPILPGSHRDSPIEHSDSDNATADHSMLTLPGNDGLDINSSNHSPDWDANHTSVHHQPIGQIRGRKLSLSEIGAGRMVGAHPIGDSRIRSVYANNGSMTAAKLVRDRTSIESLHAVTTSGGSSDMTVCHHPSTRCVIQSVFSCSCVKCPQDGLDTSMFAQPQHSHRPSLDAMFDGNSRPLSMDSGAIPLQCD